MNRISVTMLTKNSERCLKEALAALRRFDEVIVVDNGSTDNTVEIALGFDNCSIYEEDFCGFGPLKNKAAAYARNEWILSIDSDEICSPELVDEILNTDLSQSFLYIISRQNYYQNRLIRCCGWDNDRVKRLYHRQTSSFSDNQVHESLIEEGVKLKTLNSPLAHYPFDSASALIEKMQHYSTLYAQDHCAKKKTSPSGAFFRALFSFFKYYILQKGFLYGSDGLLISVSNANGVFYKYMKLYEANRMVQDR